MTTFSTPSSIRIERPRTASDRRSRFGRFGLTAVAALVSASLALSGCGEADPAPTGTGTPAPTITEAVEQQYGGLTLEDEQPAFGEPDAFTSIGALDADPVAVDPMATDPGYVAEDNAAREGGRIFVMALNWGHLRNAPLGTLPPIGAVPAEDFSGSISISQGAIGVLRTLRLEKRAQGDGVVPRTDRTTVEWKSTIYNHVDGLLLRVAAGPGATVTVKIGEQSITRAIGELDLARGVVDVPGTSGQLGWAAVGLAEGRCERGFMAGRWQALGMHNDAPGGAFRGRWVSANGELRGHLRGLFGLRPDGARVAFGKYIGEQGEIRGLLAGRYGQGEFGGVAFNRQGPMAAFHGLVAEQPGPVLRHAGHFLGTWRAVCDAEPAPAEQPDSLQ